MNQSYEEIIEKHPGLKDVVCRNSWEHIGNSDASTINFLKGGWIDNLRRNIEAKRLRKNGSIARSYYGYGRDKATVFIGAGPSLSKNMDGLKALHDFDGLKHPSKRNFVFVASNHMLKPLLKKQIIPDFVFLTDASDVVMDQLTKDIPEEAQYVTLIAGLHCSPRVLKKWEKQGRPVTFYLSRTPGMPEEYEKITGKKAEEITIMQGGNVTNSCWSLALKFFKSSVFFALGNDLSYPMETSLEARRNGYYADGDYSANLATKRDEARSRFGWMGFKLSPAGILSESASDRYTVELAPAATTGTLWVYKTWIEAQVAANADRNDISYTYYNCSEGGILGVMHRSETDYDDINNWYLLDNVCRRYKTRLLKDAVSEFLKAKEIQQWGTTPDARSATVLARPSLGDIARLATGPR